MSSELDEFLSLNGESLDSPGLAERGLNRARALEAIQMIRNAGIPLLGGDVYAKEGHKVRPAYSNWCCEPKRGETRSEFVARSCCEAEDYITRYRAPPSGEVLFVLVTA